MFRDEIVENMKQVTELRLSDLLSDEEFIGRMDALLQTYRKSKNFAPSEEQILPPVHSDAIEEEALFALHIHSPSGNQQRSEFSQREITIGRSSDSDLILRRNDISRRHARIVLRDGQFIVLDLRSENGTYINDQRIGSPQVIRLGDRIAIGDYEMYIEPISPIESGE